jgi:hypothetical protein
MKPPKTEPVKTRQQREHAHQLNGHAGAKPVHLISFAAIRVGATAPTEHRAMFICHGGSDSKRIAAFDREGSTFNAAWPCPCMPDLTVSSGYSSHR